MEISRIDLIKTCTRCKKELSITEFSKNKSTKDGLSGWCKNCTRIASKKYYANNKEHYVEKATAWRKKNITNAKKAKDAITKWKKENKEHVRETERNRYQNLRRSALEKIGQLRCDNCGCDNCGCDIYELLEINHIHGNGYQERKEKQTGAFYLEIVNGIRTTNDLNILCSPCNILHYLELLHGKLPYRIEWLGEKLLSGETKK